MDGWFGTLTCSMSSNNHNNYTPKDFLKQFISVRLLYFFMVNPCLNPIHMQRDPEAWYSLDSERDASQSEICRQGKGRDKECILVRLLRFCFAKTSTNRTIVNLFRTHTPPSKKKKLQMTSRELFTAMQVRFSHVSLRFVAPGWRN